LGKKKKKKIKPGEARKAEAEGWPILPLKLRFVAEIPTSFGANKPSPNPTQGPHPGTKGITPLSNKSFQYPCFSASAWTSLDLIHYFIILFIYLIHFFEKKKRNWKKRNLQLQQDKTWHEEQFFVL